MSARWAVEALEVEVGSFRLGPIDLSIGPGETVAVLGPSGAGKTTLLRALAGFLAPRRGQILRDREDVTAWPPESRSLGYVPQGLGLLPHRTVEGNVRFPLEVRGRPDAAARTRELLERFGLGPIARRLASRLSGGEQQRVALARTLAAEPSLIVWDEPWQGLDALARHELGRVLLELREASIPAIVVTHDPALAFSVADTFLVLEQGRPKFRGDADALIRSPTDPFGARFVGFENVFGRPALAPGTDGSLRRWLLDRAGSDGVAFANPMLGPEGSGPGPWEGTVRSARPTPQGLLVLAESDRLLVHLSLSSHALALRPRAGETLHFGIDEGSVRPLGPDDRRPTGGGPWPRRA